MRLDVGFRVLIHCLDAKEVHGLEGRKGNSKIVACVSAAAPEIGEAFALLFGHVVAVLFVGRRHGREPAGAAHRVLRDCSDRVADLVVVPDRVFRLVLRISFSAGAFADAKQGGIEKLFLRFRVDLEERRQPSPDCPERSRIAGVDLIGSRTAAAARGDRPESIG